MTKEDERGHWAKKYREENLNKILKFIKDNGKNQHTSYSDLKKVLPVSDPTLSDYLRELIKQGSIEHAEDPRDRRKKWYLIKQDKKQEVEAKLLKYEAIKFIDSIENPTYFTEKSKRYKLSATIFVPSIEGPLQKAWQINTKFMTKAWLKDLVKDAEEKKLKQILKAKPGLKVAVVLTAES